MEIAAEHSIHLCSNLHFNPEKWDGGEKLQVTTDLTKIQQHKQNAKSVIHKLNRDKIFLLLLLPTILYYVIFKYLPMFGIVISFKQYEIFKGIWESNWVGLKHYITFFQ